MGVLIGLLLTLVLVPGQDTAQRPVWQRVTFTQVQYGEGFDSCTQPASNGRGGNLAPPQLSDFLTNTPYYDFFFYLGGADATCNLGYNPGCVSQALSIGYGLLPLWVGPQACNEHGTAVIPTTNPSRAGVDEGASTSDIMNLDGLRGPVA